MGGCLDVLAPILARLAAAVKAGLVVAILAAWELGAKHEFASDVISNDEGYAAYEELCVGHDRMSFHSTPARQPWQGWASPPGWFLAGLG